MLDDEISTKGDASMRDDRPSGQTDTDDKVTAPVREAADEPVEKGRLLGTFAGVALLSSLIGFVVGVLVLALLRGQEALQSLVWGISGTATNMAILPVVICLVGGLLIGCWAKSAEKLDSLEQVLDEVRSTGGYHVRDFGKSIVTFLLPLAFGGSVGPEAGISGLAAAAVTWIGETLRHAGVRAMRTADVSVAAVLSAIFGTPFVGLVAPLEDSGADFERFTYAKLPRAVLYALSAVGAFLGTQAFVALFGGGTGLPRFEAIGGDVLGNLAWTPLLIALGYLLAQASRLFGHAAQAGFSHLDSKPLARALTCGLLLGLVALALPGVLYSGEAQTGTLMGSWGTVGAAVLIATGIVKLATTQACLAGGWMGGSFFPNIYAGVSFGYGVAALLGVNPLLSVAVVTTALLAGVTRKPVLAVSILVLCFPLVDLPWMLVAAFAAGKLPSLVS